LSLIVRLEEHALVEELYKFINSRTKKELLNKPAKIMSLKIQKTSHAQIFSNVLIVPLQKELKWETKETAGLARPFLFGKSLSLEDHQVQNK
jgi:hypothetical protein